MKNSRNPLLTTSTLLCIIVILFTGCQRGTKSNNKISGDKPNLVEIFYLPHPPALAVLKKVEDVLKKFPGISIKKYDFTNPANNKRISDHHLEGHFPIAIFINGKNEFKLADRTISLKNFPKGDAFVPTLEGTWTYDDLEQLLK